MQYLSDDPWPLVIGLGILALALLVVLKVTQQGRYLVAAGVALGLGLLVIAVEHFWVTDNERIERAVYGLAKAVQRSDGAAVVDYMAPDVEVELGGGGGGPPDLDLIRDRLGSVKIEMVLVRNLTVNAGSQSRLGTARFKVLTRVENFTADTEWDLGFRETSPGVWKIDRITPTNMPVAGIVPLRLALKRPKRASGVTGRTP